MSVINRIEVANLLNKHGDIASPWDAKMRHLLLDLRGQSSAISMENGFGKTTLAEALIGLLSRDRTLISRTRRKCSPSTVAGQGRSWSHLRVEFRSRSGGEHQDDMLAAAGEEVAGETFVFGFYGYSDGSGLSFYHYPGRLEDIPVHHLTADGMLALYANSDIKTAMSSRNVRLTHNREEWLDAVGAHVSRRELAQLAAFQKEGGADKSQIFNAIKPRGGEKADQAFFFEVLAPEILSGATRGETDESEELIEEVILNSGTHITELRHRLDEAESDQRRTADKVASLAALSADGAALLEAREARERLDQGLASLERLLGGQALAGLPGLPRQPSDDAVDTETLAGFAWAVGDTGRPRVSTWLLARLSGATERSVRQALSERGARVDAHRRLIHLPDAEWLSARDLGHVTFAAARDWLAETLSFNDDSARHRALEALDSGAEAFEALDSNRFREEVIADRAYLDELGHDLDHLDGQLESLEHDRERLEGQQREFVDNQSFYTQALADGLFSEAELEAPEHTAEASRREAEEARRALNAHLGRSGELKQVAAWHAEFRQRHPHEVPAERLAEKHERETLIKEARDDAEQQRQPLLEECRELRDEAATLRDEQQRLAGEQGLLSQGQGPWQAFVEGWPEEEPRGFWSRRKTQLAELETGCRDAEQRLHDAQREQARLAPLAEAARRYAELHGDDEPVHLRSRLREQERELADAEHRLAQREAELRELHQARLSFAECSDLTPADWLRDAQRRYPRLLSEAESLEAAIAERQRYLESLSGDPLERRAVEADAERLLQREEIAWQPLHEWLNAARWPEAQRREWLAQAAGVLFAPVVEGEANAEDVAGLLVDAGLALPVLEAGALTTRLEAGRSPLGAVQGVETLAVKAALDPRYLDELRQATERRLAADRERQAALEVECRRLDPHGEAYALAVRARQADEADVVAGLEALGAEQATLAERQAALAPRLSDAALSCIDDYQRYLEAGGQRALEEAAETALAAETELAEQRPRLVDAQQALERHGQTWLAAEQFANAGGVERLESLETRLDSLAESQAELGERLHDAERQIETLERRLSELDAEQRGLFADGERDRLRALAEFEAEGGVAFIETAAEVQEQLEARLAIANRRADFSFTRIRAYLDVRDAGGGGHKLEREIARVKREQGECRQRLKAKRDERDAVNERLAAQQRAMEWVDQLALAWLAVVRELPNGWAQRLAVLSSDQDIGSVAVWPQDDPASEGRQAALDDWWQFSGSASALELAALEACQQTLIEALHELNLGERARNRERQDKAVRALERRLAEALEAAAQSRAFSDTERARLGALKGVSAAALADLAALHDQLEAQLGEHRQRVERLHTSREQIEGTLVERLSSIIADAAGNLDILKRVARSHGEGGAYFEVKASLIDGEPLRELITTLLADIDEHQVAQRRRAERDGGMPDGDTRRRDDDLLRQIRRRIYRGLFHDVSIRLKHDAIRPHGRLFSLNEDMSEGQREAVSLMWLVKLSEFAIERELRELPGHHKRRARNSRESVILLDGLFSKLSHRRLIQDSLESLRNTRGRFQMIGLIHNPNYENDPAIFPTYLVGSVIGGVQGQGGHVMVRDGRTVEPERLGRSAGEASLFGIHVSEPVGEET
ncbi:hypothetical protein SAMN05192555_11659 [Franzmannia pantelleriensis]|uniref:Uncharacterized protein n=1 Tax=Franzmannia pantelleriensis TaxID=48727 RepID=A0A1G9UWY1_9GAMM|nr:hypothetical protein [Halomonas pantelleriensis]SDM64340.1 hypothetical protein SAMN05192555_11659 [Halomonas pantelleriensis]